MILNSLWKSNNPSKVDFWRDGLLEGDPLSPKGLFPSSQGDAWQKRSLPW